jgi:hypothetical protein
MADLSLPARDSVAAQAEMFRLAQADHGLSLRVLSQRSPISYGTLRGWQNGAAMPAWAIGELADAGIPDELLSLITEPWKRSIVTDDETETDIDDAAEAADDVVAEVRRARHPRSPGGTAIVHTEKAKIIPLVRKARAKLRSVA